MIKSQFFDNFPKMSQYEKGIDSYFSSVAQNSTTFYHPKTTNTAINYLEKVYRLYKVHDFNKKFPDGLEKSSKIGYNKEC
ncbi:hypothetical protein ACWOC1_01985 [Enterococcus quebecensis]|uniref:Uncharacterized protein n=1 Tax=Enterococcus quebecensis TaxID=903983 RepID=A0A1E5H383_9ENTE|nr:hypothetical protein [Enterococcus quebecensis]OEG19409.1 hypothetical protein BCR23_01600 [Enterococcus quebecensis]OJG75666.1 hypothetical protein RV12_GL000005 [Enterococcus quebecensis]